MKISKDRFDSSTACIMFLFLGRHYTGNNLGIVLAASRENRFVAYSKTKAQISALFSLHR